MPDIRRGSGLTTSTLPSQRLNQESFVLSLRSVTVAKAERCQSKGYFTLSSDRSLKRWTSPLSKRKIGLPE